VQQAPCSPITRRTGRCPNRLKAEVINSRLQEPPPLHQSESPADVPHDKQDGAIVLTKETNVNTKETINLGYYPFDFTLATSWTSGFSELRFQTYNHAVQLLI
jgi:hypothetical protein